MPKKRVSLYIIGIILVMILASVLRLWNVAGLFSFGIDEEYQAHLAWEQLKNFHVIWIGVNASNVGYYLGPGFVYLNALLFKVSHGDPIILGYFSSFMGILTTFSIFYITNKLFGEKAAFIATLIYASSALMIFYDRRFWNPSLLPILSVWMFYSLIKAHGDSRWLLLSSFIMAASYHIHITFWIFYPFIFFTVLMIWKKIHWYIRISALFIFILGTLPLLVFDFIHNFENLMMPIQFFQNLAQKDSSFTLHISEAFSALARIWVLDPFGSIDESVPGAMLLRTSGHIIFALLSIGVIIFNILKKNEYSSRFLVLLCLAYLTAFLLYPGSIAEYYLLAFFPLFIILSGLFLQQFSTKLLIFPSIIFIFFNCLAVFSTSQQYGLSAKKELIQKVSKQIGNQHYNLETQGSYRTFGGWRYLFKIYGKTPSQSSADEYFSWIYPDEINKTSAQYKVIISDINLDELQNPNLLKKITHQGFKAYIYNNSQ